MPNSIYRVTEIVGTSTRSWEDAVKSAVQTAAKSLRDLRVAEIGALDVTVGADGKVKWYRAKIKLSFKLGLPSAAGRAVPALREAPPKAASKKKTSKKKSSKRKSRRR
jgi:flavin-binding protein dodecin